MNVAYLVNRYPAVSHSFIRREIAALRTAGVNVQTFSIRAPDNRLVDPEDRREAARTGVILAAGATFLLLATAGVALRTPRRFAEALALALRSWRLDRRRGWRHLAYLVEACWLSRRLVKVDHIHAHFGTNPTAVARLVGRLNGVPYSFTVHGPDEFDEPINLDLRGKVRDANFVIGVSSFGRSQLMRWSDPTDWDRLHVVRCGVDASFFADETAVVPAAPTLCCVARLSAQKGIPLLIEAAALLKAAGEPCNLVLVGDGELRDEVDAMIASRDLTDRVTVTGFVEAARVRELVLASRAMVLPSFAEGLPVVIMEALALRRSVIASAIAGTPELVDGACGWLIPPGSIEALAAAMREALTLPPDALRAKGEVGRARVVSAHNAAHNAAQLARLFAAS